MYTMSFCLPCGQCSCLPLAEAPADYLSARTPTDFSEPLQSRDRLCWRYRNVWQVAARIGRHRDHVFRSQDKVYRTRNIRISAILFKLHHAANGGPDISITTVTQIATSSRSWLGTELRLLLRRVGIFQY
jgi:hypothetical protein